MWIAASCLCAQQIDQRQIKNGPIYSTSYTFTIPAASITGSLATAGAKTITLPRSPLGVAGANTNHYIRISGGTGTAEAVLITGGTCTSGAAACTLAFTTANTHTGAWVLTSATAGITEAHKANPSATAIHIPAGNFTIYAETIFSTPMALIGAGDKATFITLGSPTMNAFSGTTWLNAVGMYVLSGSAWQTAGTVFRGIGTATVQVQNVYTSQVYTAVEGVVISASDSWFAGCVNNALLKPLSTAFGLMRVSNVYADGRYYNGGLVRQTSVVGIAGAVVTRTSGATFSAMRAGGLVKIAGTLYYIASVDSSTQITLTSSPTPGSGITMAFYNDLLAPALIKINGTLAGGTFSNLWFQASQISMDITSNIGYPTNEIVVDNAIFDHDTMNIAGVAMTNNGLSAADSSNSMRFNGVYINSNGYGVLAQYVNAASFSSSYINAYDDFTAVACTSCTNFNIVGSRLNQAGTGSSAVVINATSSNITLKDSSVHLTSGSAAGLTIASSGVSGVTVAGNTFYGGTGIFVSSSLGSANVVVRGNNGSDPKKQVAVTATDTLILPIGDESTLVEVIGGGTSGTVATISGGYNGRSVRIYLSTNITFTNTANILTSLVGTSGMYLNATYDGSLSKWLIK